jgi:hypothetical protein
MTTPSISDLSALREVAEKATPGEWFVWEGELCYRDSRGMRQRLKPSAGNAIFIAGANPQVMIKLLDHLAAEKARADAAEAERDELKAEKWRAQHVDTMNDIASLRVALECAEATAADLTAKLQAAEAEHRFSLGLVDNAQATIASLTEQLAEAREAMEWVQAKMPPLSFPQANWLRKQAGRDVHPRLLDERAKRRVIRSLIDRGLITAEGWTLTEWGRATLSRLEKQEGEA